MCYISDYYYYYYYYYYYAIFQDQYVSLTFP